MIEFRCLIFACAKHLTTLSQQGFRQRQRARQVIREQIALRPYYAVYWLTGCTSDSADGEALRNLLRIAVVAFGFPLTWSADERNENTYRTYPLDDLHLPIETGCATLDQRSACCQTHLVDMPPCFEIVQRIEN